MVFVVVGYGVQQVSARGAEGGVDEGVRGAGGAQAVQSWQSGEEQLTAASRIDSGSRR